MKDFDSVKFNNYFGIKDTPSEYSIKYLEKAKAYKWLFKIIPWLKFVWVGNSVAMWYATKRSDIDLFIITHKKMLWFVRFFLILVFSIFWLRKNYNNHSWKFCLSFFVTEEGLNFKTFLIEDDIYMYFWLLTLKTVYDEWWYYDRLINENSNNFRFPNDKKIKRSSSLNNNKSYRALWIIDTFIKKLFLPRTIKSYEKLGKPYWICISDNVLKFHNNDKRKEIRDKLLTNN